ncbi:Transmembrane domain-containing protein [Orpheovirus IHUMI-LCC2]|uniref:Transmembrane domain-containing protein n=1 Tax=Orpheovirus IHUMI-LCC2 TaxID=2023057 RepID=A0A2I2L5B1_9VIRU|nr:Transmembrane domain-containing protein [Orpheovirus IHUMI-LCC2]SNW62706.1 Transmembrane domain-containing protein [Orpheovirus IHUMI-LCC2]
MHDIAFIFILAGVIWFILVFYLLIYLSLPFGFIEACFLLVPTIFLFISAAHSNSLDDESTSNLISTDTNIEIALLAVLLGTTQGTNIQSINFTILIILSLILSLFIPIPINVNICYKKYIDSVKSILQVYSISLLIYASILLLDGIVNKGIKLNPNSTQVSNAVSIAIAT